MIHILLQALSSFLSIFEYGNGEVFYFYYDIGLLIALVASSAIAFKYVAKNAAVAGRKRLAVLAAIIAVFLVVEILFVPATQQLYNDEAIHMSIAKAMIYDHIAGICSFSLEPHCVAGTAGLLQQPTGWATMLSVAFLIFGIGFGTGFNLVLLLSCITIALVFYSALMLLDNGDAALVAAALFAFTPLFLTFSRSTILDTPTLTVFMLAVSLLLTYLSGKRKVVGIAACVAIAYTMIMKVDAILILPIALVIFLALGRELIGKQGKKHRMTVVGLVIFLALLILPQLIFVYNSWNLNNFGAQQGQSRISLGNLVANAPVNVLFWFGAYGSILTPTGWQTYNIEFPLAYTLLAAIGAIVLWRGGKTREAAIFLFWFSIVFLFYTSYYGGSVLYSAGDDVRYFMLAFPAVAMLASSGIVGMLSAARKKAAKRRKRPAGAGKAKNRKRLIMLVALALLVFMVSDLAFEITTTVMKPPQDIYPFSAERFQQQIIEGNYTLIPRSCFVLTYEPPLWQVLNVSNIYADWILIPPLKSELLNLSHGCLYFEYSLDCVINTGGYKLDNTTPGCSKIMSNYTMSPIVTAPYDKFGWNYTFAIYKILSYKNGTPLYK